MADLAVGLAKSVVEGTLSKAHAAVQEEAKLRLSARRDLVFITGEFEMMRSFLNVANAERVENPVVRTWVRQIRELAYDVEDCIELVVHLDKGKTSFCFRLRRLCVPWVRPPRPPALDQAVDEIEQLKARVADVSARNARYSLIGDTGSKPVAQQQLPAAAVGDSVAASNMLAEARYAAKREQILGGDLTQLVTKESGDGHDLQVISVWGSAGEHGTTSIIMKTYSDTEICRNFTHRAWVKLMHPFSPHDFIQSLMLQFSAAMGKNVLTMLQGSQEVLFRDFQELFTHARYLVVVEDLSNMADWHALRTFLPDTRKGSWIIVSTRQPEVASLCIGHPYQILELKQFSPEHSICALFKKGSHGDGDTGEKTVEDSPDVGSVSKIDGSHGVRDKGKKPLVEDGVNDGDASETEDSRGNGDKDRKPIDQDCFLIGHDSHLKELRQYPAKTRMTTSCEVMSVWGIAGVGKSALVRKLYDGMRRSREQFEKYSWVDVSHPFNLRDIDRSIPSDFRLDEPGWLIVLDDIQSKKEWDLMQAFLVPRSSRSVIIVITTEASIASYCTNNEDLVFNVRGLEAATALRLFKYEVSKRNPSVTTALEDIRVEELILKCGGLPKVIVAIASVLSKQTVTWMDTVVSLNKRFMHHLQTKPDYDSLRGLLGWMHSYFHSCPDSIKPCIFYVSIFPRDHPIRRRRLVRRWIAEGYSRDGDEESAEENGEKQFSELLDLSIIQQLPHLVTNALNTRMVLCQVNGFIREYIIPRRKEENLMFELGANCALTTQRTGRHIIILRDWKRDIIVFESMDFSRLRSLTVFGEWKSFFISENMMLLRVLDLEDASNVEYEDLENIVKWLRRLKFLSLRGRREIHYLPDNMDYLRQLQTLDVRGTSIVTLPENISKLQKLQYIRAGTNDIPASTSPSASSWLPEFCRYRHRVGVKVPEGIGKLTALHTLGVINVSATSGKSIMKALKKLTQLRKLGVSGVNRKNSKDFFAAIEGHMHMESLSVHFDEDNQGLHGIPLPLENLRSLKLYRLNEQLPDWSERLSKLTKLDLEMATLMQNDMEVIGRIPRLCILRLRVKQLQDGNQLQFSANMYGNKIPSFLKVKILEIACGSSSGLDLTFGSESMKNLELLKFNCCSESSCKFSGLENISELKEVLLKGTNAEALTADLQSQLDNNPKRPVLKLEELPRSS